MLITNLQKNPKIERVEVLHDMKKKKKQFFSPIKIPIIELFFTKITNIPLNPDAL